MHSSSSHLFAVAQCAGIAPQHYVFWLFVLDNVVPRILHSLVDSTRNMPVLTLIWSAWSVWWALF